MPGNLMTEEDINLLANELLNFEIYRFPQYQQRSLEQFTQIILLDLEVITPIHEDTLPILLAIQREQNMSNDYDDSPSAPAFFDLDTYRHSVQCAIIREHENNELGLDRKHKIINDLLDNLQFLQDPHGFIRASVLCKLEVVGKSNFIIVDPYNGAESKIERYLRMKDISLESIGGSSDIPRDFIDPITLTFMLKPIKDALDFSYDFNSIKLWLEQFPIDSEPRTPLSNVVLPNLVLQVDEEKEAAILNFLITKYGPQYSKLKA